jgi:protein-disulfide isomerase
MFQAILILFGVVAALTLGLQVLVRVRANAMRGRTLPSIPGPIGAKLAAAKSALVYFTSPSCGACRPWTPRIKELSRRNQNVFLVDISQNLEVARALSVMATPTTIEVRDGQVAGVHIGAIPKELLERFA